MSDAGQEEHHHHHHHHPLPLHDDVPDEHKDDEENVVGIGDDDEGHDFPSSPGRMLHHLGLDEEEDEEAPPPPPVAAAAPPEPPTNVEEEEEDDTATRRQEEIVASTKPTTELEKALTAILARKNAVIERITSEIQKLKSFVQKRKQTYKRKRKDDGAPIRAMSAYNLFIKERFEQLSKENEKALKSEDAGAELKRVPPSSLVAKTGNEWKELPAEIKAQYEERAKADRKRYAMEMAEYQPPDSHANRKRNKTGYNMFFSAHVLRLKATESGVPSERGSVARLVGNAWKALTAEEKQYYEREADKHNGTLVAKEGGGGEEEEDEEEAKMQQQQHHMDHQQQPYAYPAHGGDMGHHGMHQHDPRAHHQYYPPHMYPQNPYGHYDYSQHHQRHNGHGRQQMYQYAPHNRHYDSQI